MSVGRNLQEMENVVTKGAAPAEPMHTIAKNASSVSTPGQSAGWEDLGGPTPDNYRPDDDSAKLNTPGKTLAQVRNVVNAKASSAEASHTSATSVSTPGQGVRKEDAEYDEDDELLEEVDEEDDEDEDEDEDEDKKSKKKVEEAKKEDDEEKEDEDEEDDEDEKGDKKKKMEEDFDIEEDVNALLEGENLSEEFQEKARTIFEAAIRSKVTEIKESLQTAYEEALLEEVEALKESLVDRVDSYLEYVADEWIQENALAVEHGLKTEITESFLAGMKQLFEDHYVTIPEDRYDVVESMVDKLDEMEEKLNEQIEKNVALNRRLAESVADVIFADVSEGLALSQKDKFASLAENVEFDGEENYREKLVTLRESYFPNVNAGAQRHLSENLSEETNSSESLTPMMESYLQVLSRVAKK